MRKMRNERTFLINSGYFYIFYNERCGQAKEDVFTGADGAPLGKRGGAPAPPRPPQFSVYLVVLANF